MNVAEYLQISDTKPETLSKLLKVTDEAVRRYITGERKPKRKIAEKLIEISGGRITWGALYGAAPTPIRRKSKPRPASREGR